MDAREGTVRQVGGDDAITTKIGAVALPLGILMLVVGTVDLYWTFRNRLSFPQGAKGAGSPNPAPVSSGTAPGAIRAWGPDAPQSRRWAARWAVRPPA
jgi:hypothetical protein